MPQGAFATVGEVGALAEGLPAAAVRLVESRPKALAKDSLYQELWPDTFVVDANLSNLISEIRAALGDSAQHPRFVRTLHGFGYAFVADAIVEMPAPDADTAGPGVIAYLRLADGQTLPIRPGETVVGRASDVQARLDFSGISRRHARILLEGQTAVLEDLASKNGTFHRGERVTDPQHLANGDEVAFGSVRAVFHMLSPDRSTDTAHWLDHG